MSKINLNLSLIVLLLSFFACNKKAEKENYTLGNAQLEVTGSPEAKALFNKALLLLHSFEYDDAKEAFVAAQEADSMMMMAYWGEALTYNHPLWRYQDYDNGEKAIKAFQVIIDGKDAKYSSLENDLFKSVEVMYGEGTKHERDVAYSNHLARLYEKYPKNLEVAAFYAISLLGSVKEGRDDAIYEKGAIIAQGILNENPNHPGALHYLIHSYDDPKNARRALDAANSYASVAKDAGHALHMPSHIYVSMGMWKEVVASNEASYQASIDRMERKQLDHDARGYHAYHWLMYGYLQQGRDKEAYDILTKTQQYAKEKPSRRARSYVIYMENTYLTETNDWLNPINDLEVDETKINVRSAAKLAFSDGMKAFVNKDKELLKNQIDRIEIDLQRAVGQLETRGIAMCSGNWMYSAPNQQDIDEAKVIQLELKALSAWLEIDTDLTEKYFKEATKLEDEISFSFGPPIIAKPSHELYADWLLAQDRPKDAIMEYDKALEKGPNRVLAISGKLSAAKLIQELETVQECEKLLNEILNLADSKNEKLLNKRRIFS